MAILAKSYLSLALMLPVSTNSPAQSSMAIASRASQGNGEAARGEWPAIVNWYTVTMKKFAAPNEGAPTPVVYKLPDAPHYFYLIDPSFVVRVMREFLLGSVGN